MRDFGNALEGVELDNDLGGYTLSRRAAKFLETRLSDILISDIGTASVDCGVDLRSYHVQQRTKIKQVLDFYWPNVDRDDPQCLYLWPDAKARAKGRSGRQAMRIGRALRRMFPMLTDPEIDKLVDEVKSKLLATDFIVKKGTDAASFRKAYSYEQAHYENVDTTWSKKHMANSCMRYEFDRLPNHPAEAYASGDFTMLWLETSSGQIGGRCVVWTAPEVPQAAPIYCVSEKAYEVLSNALSEMGAKDASWSSWVGAKLDAIAHNGGWIAPYLDLEPRSLTLDGDYLVVDECGEIDGSSYSGVLSEEDGCTCVSCEDRVSEYRTQIVQDEVVCNSCVDHYYFMCEHSDELYPNDQAVTVYRRNWRGNTLEELWCDDSASTYAVECSDGRLWPYDETMTTADNETISIEQYEDSYFTCSLSDEIYHCDYAQSLDNGDMATLEAIQAYNESQHDYQLVSNEVTGEWEHKTKTGSKEQCTA